MKKTKEEWKEELSPKQYHTLFEKGTEQPFSGEFYQHKENGTYLCAACGNELFESETKYDSGSGWPSFYKPYKEGSVEEEKDTSHGMVRMEVHCSNCGGHLGHVFPDGPQPGGLRYCINSTSMKFKKRL